MVFVDDTVVVIRVTIFLVRKLVFVPTGSFFIVVCTVPLYSFLRIIPVVIFLVCNSDFLGYDNWVVAKYIL